MLRLLQTTLAVALTCCALIAQPANDDCSAAIAIAIDEVVDFSTADATSDPLDTVTCFGANDSIPLDVWYTFTAAEDDVLVWSTCNTADFDTRMAAYQTADACAAGQDNLIACNDDGTGCAEFTSSMIFLVEAGETYVLRLGGYGTDTTVTTFGEGTVLLSAANGPDNDFCVNATTVELGENQQFSTVDAITDGPSHEGNPCFAFGSITAVGDIWYEFTPTFTGAVRWSTCGTATFDTRLAVYEPGSACPPAGEDLYACNDDGGGCADFTSVLDFDVDAGQTYILRLGGFNGTGNGSFSLTETERVPPPVNDDCANALPIFIYDEMTADDGDSLTVGTTVGGSFVSEGYQFPQCLANQAGGEFSDVWYIVETVGNSELEVRFQPDDNNDNEGVAYFVDVFSSCDTQLDTLTSGLCFSTDADNLAAIETIPNLTPGVNETLYIRVTTRLTSEAPGSFFLQLVGSTTTGVRETPFASALQLFPNPVADAATVRFATEASERVTATVYDMFGRRVSVRDLGQLPAGNQQFTVETADLPAGVYSLELGNGRARQNLKFVVQ